MKKILPLHKNNDIGLYTHHSLPLQIPMVNDNTYGWYMTCFINIGFRYDYPHFFDYLDYKNFYEYLTDRDILTYSMIPYINDVDHFKQFIDAEKYIYAWVDQYFISGTSCYNMYHDIHPVLIYGYNEEKNVYYCLAFSLTGGVYELEVPREEYHTALKQMDQERINDDDLFCLFKIKPNLIAEFDLELFVNELNNYLNGQGSFRTTLLARTEIHHMPEFYNKSAFGIEVTRACWERMSFDKETDERIFDYRVLFMVCENKKLISNRLQYLIQKYPLTKQICDLISDYERVSGEYESVRLLTYKYSFAETRGRSMLSTLRDPKHIAFVCDKMQNMYRKEKSILRELIPLLQEFDIEQKIAAFKFQKMTNPGQCCFQWGEPHYVDSIVLYNPLHRYQGILEIMDQNGASSIEIDASSAHNFWVVTLGREIYGCRFVPGDPAVANNSMWITEKPEKASYSVSSSDKGESGRCSVADRLGSDVYKYWRSDKQDEQPFVDLEFDETIEASRMFVSQQKYEKPIASAVVHAWVDGNWEEIANRTDVYGQKEFIIYFEPIRAKKFRLQITKTIADEKGRAYANVFMIKVL